MRTTLVRNENETCACVCDLIQEEPYNGVKNRYCVGHVSIDFLSGHNHKLYNRLYEGEEVEIEIVIK